MEFLIQFIACESTEKGNRSEISSVEGSIVTAETQEEAEDIFYQEICPERSSWQRLISITEFN